MIYAGTTCIIFVFVNLLWLFALDKKVQELSNNNKKQFRQLKFKYNYMPMAIENLEKQIVSLQEQNDYFKMYIRQSMLGGNK